MNMNPFKKDPIEELLSNKVNKESEVRVDIPEINNNDQSNYNEIMGRHKVTLSLDVDSFQTLLLVLFSINDKNSKNNRVEVKQIDFN